MPNCGKSTIINRLVGRNVTMTGDRPGVTKGQAWLKTPYGIQILDTPGILWPKFEDQDVGYKLAAFGAIKDTIFHADDVALFVIRQLRQYYPAYLAKFANCTKDKLENIGDTDLLLAMTQNNGMRDDYDRFSLFMLQRLRKGKLAGSAWTGQARIMKINEIKDLLQADSIDPAILAELAKDDRKGSRSCWSATSAGRKSWLSKRKNSWAASVTRRIFGLKGSWWAGSMKSAGVLWLGRL